MFLNKVNGNQIKKLNTLIYSTDLYNRNAIINMIKKFGIQNVNYSNNFGDLEKQLKEDDIELLFLEVDIFLINIQDFLEKLNTHKTFRHIPKILITTDTDYRNHTFSTELGFEEILIKPFNLGAIQQALSNLFERYNKQSTWFILNSIRKLLDDNQLDLAYKFINQIDNKVVDFYLKYLKALYYFKRTDYKKTLQELAILLTFKPSFIEAYKLMAQCYNLMKEQTKELEALEKVIEYSPKNPIHNLKIGKLYLKENNTVKAEKHLKYTESVNPKATNLCTMLANLYIKKGDLIKAERYLKRASRNADTPSTQELNNIALDFKKQKAFDKALHFFKYAQEQSKQEKGREDAAILYNIATLHFEQQDYTKATFFIKEALKQNPSFKEAITLRSRIAIDAALKNNE